MTSLMTSPMAAKGEVGGRTGSVQDEQGRRPAGESRRGPAREREDHEGADEAARSEEARVAGGITR